MGHIICQTVQNNCPLKWSTNTDSVTFLKETLSLFIACIYLGQVVTKFMIWKDVLEIVCENKLRITISNFVEHFEKEFH